MIGALLALTLTIVAVPDPGTTAAGATVGVRPGQIDDGVRRQAVVGADNRATVEVPDVANRSYTVELTKPGFVPARGVFIGKQTTVRIAFHAAPAAALRTIGSVAAAERGAFNRGPAPIDVLPREGYRDQGRPDTATVLSQTPSVAVDRAARGLTVADAPPVALVRGGTPLETQMLIEGVPVTLPTTRTFALSAIPAFVTHEIEVHPGTGAPLPATDGAVNGSLNVRFAEPTALWRALPELGSDSRGGSFADVSVGGASANRRVGVALVATSNGAKGPSEPYDAIQRALLVKARAALSPAATFSATGYSEADGNRFGANGFGFSEAELRLNGARSTVLARWWHASAVRIGTAAGDPFEFRTEDALTGASLEYDRTRGTDLFSLGLSETYGLGSAHGATSVAAGAFQRVQTAFVRAIVHPARRLETQLAFYEFRADYAANGASSAEFGYTARIATAWQPSRFTTVRASIGAAPTPPSLIAFAGRAGRVGPSGGGSADLGIEQRVFDRWTTLSADVFATKIVDRLVETRFGSWIDVGAVQRRGAEFSLARRPPAGLGYLLQAWTASETPALLTSSGDIASGATHGYAEISYHGAQGSRVSLGATYWGADAALAQPAVVMLNANVEIQAGARGKIQFSFENLNDAARAVASPAHPFVAPASPFAPGPRTLRLLLRRSFGRSGSDG